MSFLEKYGQLISIGVIVVLIIVVLYMSYEYSAGVINAGLGSMQSAKASIVQDLAVKMGGNVPVS